MILACNSCGKKFVVPDSAITASGRMVQCGSCGNKWKQFPENKVKTSSTISSKGPIKQKVKKEKKPTPKKTREISLYSPEYLAKKHGIKINETKTKKITKQPKKNNIPFEGPVAASANHMIFKHIKDDAMQETLQLAVERGACPDDDSCRVRNAHLLAIAPNASSSIICGNTSPSIEPFRANAYTQKTKSGSYLQKNKFLEELLEKYEKNDDKTWRDIVTNKGSVQHLEFLSDMEKEVFKTAVEINQAWVIEHAAERQQFICQSQSLNLFFPPDVNKGELHNIHMVAWAKNLKTLYYLRSEAISRADNVSNEVKREIIFEQQDCLSCEG